MTHYDALNLVDNDSSRLAPHDLEKSGPVSITSETLSAQEDTGDYAQGLQLFLICTSLCLCVFLVGLVSIYCCRPALPYPRP